MSSERLSMSSRRLILFALKFSRGPYFDNHLSEGVHTWTISTLLGWLSFHAIGRQGPCPGTGATGSKSSTCSKCGISGLMFSRCSYLDILIRKHSYLDQRYHIGLALIP